MRSPAAALVRHVWKTLRHKWYVGRAGVRLGVSWWRLLIHDWSKFTPLEATGYAGHFEGGPPEWAARWPQAWQHHLTSNDHHPEYWAHCLGWTGPAPMPTAAVREMVADWCGARRAYDGGYPTDRTTWDWYQTRYLPVVRATLHPVTAARTDAVLDAWFLNPLEV
jgi:hypothetical protein